MQCSPTGRSALSSSPSILSASCMPAWRTTGNLSMSATCNRGGAIMKRLLIGLVFVVLTTSGCGGDSTPNTSAMSDEEIRKMKEEDRKIDDEERGGSGSATPARKR